MSIERYIIERQLDNDYIQSKCKTTEDSIIIPLYSSEWLTGGQIRYINPEKHWWVKSTTWPKSRWSMFLLDEYLDASKPIIIVEGEIDFLSIIPYVDWYNLIGLKWCNSLNRVLMELKEMYRDNLFLVYLLLDNDWPADEVMNNVCYTPRVIYDLRAALWGCKDVNEAIIKWELNLCAEPKKIKKKEPPKKRSFQRDDTIDNIEKINTINAMDVLSSLFTEYSLRWNESICENGKETHWYKYSRSLNIVSDFSGKGRPAWTTFNIAKAKFWDARSVFLYFSNRL